MQPHRAGKAAGDDLSEGRRVAGPEQVGEGTPDEGGGREAEKVAGARRGEGRQPGPVEAQDEAGHRVEHGGKVVGAGRTGRGGREHRDVLRADPAAEEPDQSSGSRRGGQWGRSVRPPGR